MPSYPIYQVEIRHEGLNKCRLIKGTERYVVEQKATAQKQAWDEMWAKKQAAEAGREDRLRRVHEKEEMRSLASERTADALEVLAGIE